MTPALGRDLGHGMQCDLDLIRNIYLNSSNGVLGESQLLPLCLIGNETWEQVGKTRKDEAEKPVKTRSARPGRTDSTRAVATTPPKPALENFFHPTLDTKVFMYLLSQMERIITRKENGIPAMKSVFGEVLSRIKWERKWKCAHGGLVRFEIHMKPT